MQSFLRWLGRQLFGAPKRQHAGAAGNGPRRHSGAHRAGPGETRRRTSLIAEARGERPAEGRQDPGPPTRNTGAAGADEALPDPAGFDPYNTGSYDRSNNWSRSGHK